MGYEIVNLLIGESLVDKGLQGEIIKMIVD